MLLIESATEQSKGVSLGSYLLLAATFFIWGSNYIAGKYAMETLPPAAVAGGRYLVASLTLLLVGRKTLKVKIDREDYRQFLVIGVLGYYLQTMVNMIGVKLIGASTAALINSLNPVSITLVAALVLHERIDGIKLLCLALSVSSAAVISSGALGASQSWGVLLSLSAIILWAVASVDMRRMCAKYGAMTVTLRCTLISLALFIPTATISLLRQESVSLSWGAAGAIVYLGVVGAALGSYLWSKALSRLEAGFCSLFYPLQALFSALLGALLLQERFSASFYIGGALVVISVVITYLHQRNLEKNQRRVNEVKA